MPIDNHYDVTSSQHQKHFLVKHKGKLICQSVFSFNEEHWNESTGSPISFLPSSLISSKHLFVSVRMVRSRLEHVQNRLSSAGMFAIMVTSHKIPKKVQEIFLASSHRLGFYHNEKGSQLPFLVRPTLYYFSFLEEF